MLKPLREHQAEALVGAMRELELPAGAPLPPTGLRTQVIMATGSGKTLVAVHTSEELTADRVLVLVPSLDLLEQTARAWREGGRPGAFFGVSSLKSDEVGFPNTTVAGELVTLTSGPGRITVFATYASLGLGFLEAAHAAGLPHWNLIIVDEAHRTSGRAGKPWAVIHDNTRIPAERRLYMTATPRVWQAGEVDEDEPGRRGPGELVASMLDDPDGVFGRVAYFLSLEEAIERGIIAPYQVLVVDVHDPALNTALRTAGDGSEEVRGKRLGALQAATLKVSAKEELRRVLSFHQRVAEAEAFALGLPGKAGELYAKDPDLYPAEDEVWSEWLHGEHKPSHRRRVLGQFAAGATDAGTETALSLVASVKVLGEGVDTRECDAVVFADVRGSMPDLVQAVGRALRMHPGEGKIATLVVPAFLTPGETPDAMLTSPAYTGLAKLLTALRAHDARIEKLTEPSRSIARVPEPREEATGLGEDLDQDGDDEDTAAVSRPAKELLRFSAPRDARQLASFIELRVLNPERVHWRRGIQAAQRYATEHQDLRVPYGYRTPADWSPADFPLGVWVTDCRRNYNAGRLDAERTAQLEKLGMVWSSFDAGFEEGLAAAAAWAAEHEVGLAAPVDATQGEYPVGRWLKNQRAAARKADELERRRAVGVPEPDGGAAPLSDERRQALENIDPGWCPNWGIDWQRCFRLAWNHTKAGNPLPDKAGQAVADGEDLGKWAAAQRASFAKLTATQQWMLTSVLGITAAPAKRSRAEMWSQNLAAARQYREREGHLEVPRSHTEQIGEQAVRLGAWISQQRVKASKLAPERVEELTALGMRWALSSS
ncbi:Helicase associated domain protein [Streptomyces sp. HNM0663]|uniref:Helicase associated domain protein n=1 Tax=Streptomyces chengmaiensis TaxID=3040919 RepID=A0ABT6HXF4_9ACTN|nr:DEAD/DEAH box helicase [Streptomyces chengmaiensis]MDH2393381.1 Helicase associated domain protein [Streptomyces chengmaiensis]